MSAPYVSRRVGDWFWMAIGVLGLVIIFDSMLFVLAMLALVLGGGAGNPYSGIYVFFLFPVAVVAGCALCWLSYEMMTARRAAAVPGARV